MRADGRTKLQIYNFINLKIPNKIPNPGEIFPAKSVKKTFIKFFNLSQILIDSRTIAEKYKISMDKYKKM